MAVQIPVPQLHPEVAVNQHLVPQCYMREWSYNGRNSVWIYDKATHFNSKHPEQSDWSITPTKTDKINSLDYFHDTRAGDFYMPEEGLDELFGFLTPYTISLNRIPLDTPEKLNKNYRNFANWNICNPDGSEVPPTDRQKIQAYLDESRYTYIETQWSRQYENNWRKDITALEQKLLTLKAQPQTGTLANSTVTADDLNAIIEYMTIFEWRCRDGYWAFNDVLDTLASIVPEIINAPIPPAETANQLHAEDVTFKDQIRHQLLLKNYDGHLRDNSGSLEEVININKAKLSPCFCLTESAHPLITSDKPVYIRLRSDNQLEYVFVARPTLLVPLGRGDKTEFLIRNLTSDEVDTYNKATAAQGNLLIVPSNTFPISKLFTS